jgi:XapX domain-containing protein
MPCLLKQRCKRYDYAVDIKFLIGILIALLIGASCRYFNLPVPAPPSLLGVLLIVAISCGYLLADNFLPKTEIPISQVEIKK